MSSASKLPVNFQDDILEASMGGKRRYMLTPNADGTQSIEDATTYDQVGSNFGAAQINATNTAVNALSDDVDAINNSLAALSGKNIELLANTNSTSTANKVAVDLTKYGDIMIGLGQNPTGSIFNVVTIPTTIFKAHRDVYSSYNDGTYYWASVRYTNDTEVIVCVNNANRYAKVYGILK